MRKAPHAGGDVDPGAKRTKKGNNTPSVASSSAVQPAAPAADLIDPPIGSAVQPADKRPKKEDNNPSMASSSAVQPAAPRADLVEKVQKLGHYPRRFKKAETNER